ncbi:MAG: HesA/MoeB/ThiF family protein [Ferrovibrionaceae bacterium]
MDDDQLERYARHIILREIGGAGQQALLRARVLVVGGGGLGSPLIYYLAAAGVGTIGVVDDDVVGLSNLQRQILHRTADIDTPKVDSAARAVAALNPDIRLVPHRERLTQANARALIGSYDIVADGSDNFDTRFLLNDVCFALGRTLVSGAILRFDGQLSTFKAHLGANHPCYRCLFPAPPPPEMIPNCAEGGVLGALAGTIGALQATEVVKEILGLGRSLSGRLVMHDALEMTFRTITVPKDPDCPLCGERPTITVP